MTIVSKSTSTDGLLSSFCDMKIGCGWLRGKFPKTGVSGDKADVVEIAIDCSLHCIGNARQDNNICQLAKPSKLGIIAQN